MKYGSMSAISTTMTAIWSKLAKPGPKSVEKHKNDIEGL